VNGSRPGPIHTVATIVALVVVWIIATFMLFCGVALGREELPPPDWSRVMRLGCRIDQVDPPPNYLGGVSRFRVTVWARYQTNPGKAPEWQMVYSMRDAGKDNAGRKKAMADCDDWLREAEANAKRAREEE